MNQLKETVAMMDQKIAQQETVLNKFKINPKSCVEMRDSNPSSESGMYWIDPDGHALGDPPVYVYCNMTTGSTLISHDNEDAADVGHCKDPGCYSRSIKYNATMKQMMTLIQQSVECQQFIQVKFVYFICIILSQSI